MDIPNNKHLDIESRTLADHPDTIIREIILSRPEKHNALPDDTIESLAETFETVESEDGDAIVLAATGDDFCLGSDVNDLNPDTIDDPSAPAKRMQRLVMSIRSCPLPVVTLVHGRAFGAGFLLCLGADFIIATDDATFALPEADLGIPIAGFTTVLLPRLIGERRAREWMFTSTHITSTTAAAAGFVTRAVPANNVDESLNDLLVRLAESSTAALAVLKSQMISPTCPDKESLQKAECDGMKMAFTEGDAPDRLHDLL